MSLIKRYTNIYHPHFTGISRYMLTQAHLSAESEYTDRLANLDISKHFAHSVEITIDTDVCVQADVVCPDGYIVRYLNIMSSEAKSCAQCALYDSHQAAFEAADKWKNHSFNKGLEQFIYEYMAVPVVFKKAPIDPFFTMTPFNFNFEHVFIEEKSFHVDKDKKTI